MDNHRKPYKKRMASDAFLSEGQDRAFAQSFLESSHAERHQRLAESTLVPIEIHSDGEELEKEAPVASDAHPEVGLDADLEMMNELEAALVPDCEEEDVFDLGLHME